MIKLTINEDNLKGIAISTLARLDTLSFLFSEAYLQWKALSMTLNTFVLIVFHCCHPQFN